MKKTVRVTVELDEAFVRYLRREDVHAVELLALVVGLAGSGATEAQILSSYSPVVLEHGAYVREVTAERRVYEDGVQAWPASGKATP